MDKKEGKDVAKMATSRLPSTLEEMERWFDDAFRRPMSLFGAPWWPRMGVLETEEFSPSVDMFREGNDVIVKAEIPGIKKEDIDISLADDTITITGERKKEEKVERKDYYRLERSHGSFSRSFRMPQPVQSDKAKAKFKDGVLEIRIPITEEAKKKEKKLSIE